MFYTETGRSRSVMRCEANKLVLGTGLNPAGVPVHLGVMRCTTVVGKWHQILSPLPMENTDIDIKRNESDRRSLE
jgi:hypothetical protein